MKKLLFIFTVLFSSQNMTCSEDARKNQDAKTQQAIKSKEKVLIALSMTQGVLAAVIAFQFLRGIVRTNRKNFVSRAVQFVAGEVVLSACDIATNFICNKVIPNTAQTLPVKNEVLDSCNINASHAILTTTLRSVQGRCIRHALGHAFSNPELCGFDLRYSLFAHLGILLTNVSTRMYTNYNFSNKTAQERENRYISQGLLEPGKEYYGSSLFNDLFTEYDLKNLLSNSINFCIKNVLLVDAMDNNLQLLIDPTGKTKNHDVKPYRNNLRAIQELRDQQALLWHPDQQNGDDRPMKVINAAYSQLEKLVEESIAFNERQKSQ